MLKLSGITKIYDVADERVVALDGVNIEFRQSEFVSVLGPSGCGKTTMLNIIGGLDKYTSGDMFISGISTAEYTDRDWDAYRNHSIGFVFQNYNLIQHLTVLDNVELALNLVGEDKETRSERALKALESVGLRNKAFKKPNQLSGGQMQRVAIARALINNPDIILADEPTGALDSETSVQIMGILKEISKTRLVIMVTHNGELAREYSTRIVKLFDGKVVGDTNPYVPTNEVVNNDSATVNASAVRIENGRALEDYSPLKKEEIALANNCYLQNIDGRQFVVFTTPRGKLITPMTPAIKKERKGDLREKKALSAWEADIVRGLFDLATEENTAAKKYERKPAMKFSTAIKLSLTNLLAKRFRSILTAVAGSIGVIGIALILALNAGLNGFIDKQEVALASYPITINRSTDNITAMVDQVVSSLDGLDGKYEKDKVYVYKLVQKLLENQKNHYNGFDVELLESIRQIDSDLYFDIYENYGLNFNAVKKIPSNTNILGIHRTSGMYYMAIDTARFWSELPCEELVLEQYELIAGEYPKDEKQIVLVLDGKNQISDINLFFNGLDMESVTLNYKAEDDIDGLTFDVADFVGQEYKLVNNDKYYTKNDDGSYKKKETEEPNGTLNAINKEIEKLVSGYKLRFFEGERLAGSQGGYNYDTAFSGSITLTVSGVIKLKDGVSVGALGTNAIGYTTELTKYVIKSAYESAVLKAVMAAYEEENPSATDIQKSDRYKGYGYAYIPNSINIYCRGYGQKTAVKDAVAAISEERKAAGKSEIMVTDVMSIVLNIVKQFINIITCALLSLTAISLIVSLLMIGIITYTSVLERTREIGVLRALGARKKDISRIFSAETIVIGFVSGVLGVVLTYIASWPLGAMFESLTGIAGLMALPWFAAIGVVAVNVLLTFVAGLIPSGIAKRKDPVKALRAE